jgi:curved DNA-binding protein
LQRPESNHYATLGLDRDCTPAQIRAAYRILARQYHPDLNPDSSAAVGRTQTLNAAHETLSDPARRRAYDHELDSRKKSAAPSRVKKTAGKLSREIFLRLEEFFRGATLEVRVHNPALTEDHEIYPLVIPPATAPGTCFRVPRNEGGFVMVKVKARPDFRFKVRGSDLRCDLRIRPERAKLGGIESVRGALGNFIRVTIPSRTASGEIIRIAGEGMPKARGGRGDLLMRITYSPQVRITRK